jgi:hypothetical protein
MNKRRDESKDRRNHDFANGVARSNGILRFAGTWSPEEHREFEENIASLEEIEIEIRTDAARH